MKNIDEFNEYKKFCERNNLKACNTNNLKRFLDLKRNKRPIKNNFIVVSSITNHDRISIIEDYYMWANKKNYNLEYYGTFLEYKEFLLGGKQK